ncbi:XVIPCD domain-containing protein [Stenotrophomonas sp.]|uniref:XVIPCD domain-containing protein n=1 Tax=Stenotrophomonas sp. TaxID=69392 RepID=UPI0028A5AE42|nr:XVIPCD domain-containing protein [Stenotrophomonas sp.]
MTDKVILGIHSHVDPNTQGSFNQFVDGHAWISVTRNGATQYYGLWPDEHPLVEDNGPETDIRVGMEARSRASASRYYELTPEQVQKLDQALGENVEWAYTNTCASWSTATLTKVTGQTLDAGELMFTDTPRELIGAIRKAERIQPTTPSHPQPPPEPKQQESSGRSLGDASTTLHRQAMEGVARLDLSLGRAPDESSERMAASLAHLARDQGLNRIDHVVLGTPTGQSPNSQNVFVVQGALDDPAHRRAHMDVNAALRPSVEESIQKLQQADNRLAAAPAIEPSQTLDEIQHRRQV